MTTALRSCAGCSAHILTADTTSQSAWCPRCQPDHAGWAAGVGPGSEVYVQLYAAWRGLSHSRHLVIARDGDQLTVQILGLPESRTTVDIAHCGPADMTPRRLM